MGKIATLGAFLFAFLFSTASSFAATFTIYYTGVVSDRFGSDNSVFVTQPVSGSIVLDDVTFLTSDHTPTSDSNYYTATSGSGAVGPKSGGTSGSIGLEKLTSGQHFLVVSTTDASQRIELQITANNSSVPLTTLAQFPTNYAAALAYFASPIAVTVTWDSFSSPTYFKVNITDFSVAQAPIPGAVLLLGTAPGGLGFLGYRRKRLETAA